VSIEHDGGSWVGRDRRSRDDTVASGSGLERRPLRIAFILNQLSTAGTELRALRLVEHLPRDRFEFEIIASSGAGRMDPQARDAGARVRYVGSRPLVDASLPTRVGGRLAKLVRYIGLARAARYDIVNAWLYPADVIEVFGRFVTGTPVIIAGRFNQHPREAFGPLSARVDAIVNARVDAIVANSEVVASQQRGQIGVSEDRLHVIRNGVELSAPLPPDERRRVRSDLGAGDDDFLIGSVGNLREVKRQSLLIDSFADLAQTWPQVRLAIIGEGPMRASLERQVQRLGLGARVRLPGDASDVGPLFAAFDVVALSSRSEGLPNALLEAAAAGRPIVTTAAGGAIEAVVDGVTGLVVPVEDRVALSSALARLISDPQLRQRYGSAAQEHVKSQFGMDRFVTEWGALFERLAVAKGLIDG
jgi:glycosyltransferase involved in cell wall biosynthesis